MFGVLLKHIWEDIFDKAHHLSMTLDLQVDTSMPLLQLTVGLDWRSGFLVFEAALVGVYPFGQTHIPSLDYDPRVEITIYIDVTRSLAQLFW